MSQFFKILDQRLNLRYLHYRLWVEAKEITRFIGQRRSLNPQTRFSIVVPCYGIKLIYVIEMVESLKRQSYKNWELCIADDGDPDPQVWQYFNQLKLTWGERLKLTRHEKNAGICAATRSAISLAKGDFVVFIDADDTLHAQTLQLLALRIAEVSDCDFVYSDHDFMTDWSWRIFPLRKPDWSPELLLTVNYINHITAVRREILTSNTDFFADRFSGGQDTDFVLKMISRSRRVLHVPFVLYHWRTRPGSVAASVDAKPWAFAAGALARSEYVRSLGLGLKLNRGVLAREQNSEPLKIHIADEERRDGGEWISFLTSAAEGEAAEKLLFFGSDSIEGELEPLLAYVTLPQVGVGHVFFKKGLRAAYSSGKQNPGVMKRVTGSRSAYSHYTGNIQAGPLLGAAMQVGSLRRILEALKVRPDFLSMTLSLSAVGVFMGLTALRLGLRNVSVDGAWIKEQARDQIDDQLEVPAELWPRFDNYF